LSPRRFQIVESGLFVTRQGEKANISKPVKAYLDGKGIEIIEVPLGN
jgi:hypothetical protein